MGAVIEMTSPKATKKKVTKKKVAKKKPVRQTKPSPAEELSAIERTIRELQAAISQESAGMEWKIGRELQKVYEKDLWRSVEGVASFAEYALKIFGLKQGRAYGYLKIAATFTEKEARDVGVGQLWELALVPDDGDRKKMLSEAKREKLSTRELRERVKEKRREAGLLRPPPEPQTKQKEEDVRAAREEAAKDGAVLVTARLKPGQIVAESEWIEGADQVDRAEFKIGDRLFILDDVGEGKFRVRFAG